MTQNVEEKIDAQDVSLVIGLLGIVGGVSWLSMPAGLIVLGILGLSFFFLIGYLKRDAVKGHKN